MGPLPVWFSGWQVVFQMCFKRWRRWVVRGWRRGGDGGVGVGEVVVWLLAMEVEIQDFSGRWGGGEVRMLACESEGSRSGSFA